MKKHAQAWSWNGVGRIPNLEWTINAFESQSNVCNTTSSSDNGLTIRRIPFIHTKIPTDCAHVVS